MLPGGIGILHVGAHFDDVEDAVAIPGHRNGFLNIGITEDEFQAIAILQFDGFLGFLDGEIALLVDGIAGRGEKGDGENEREKAFHAAINEPKERDFGKGSFVFGVIFVKCPLNEDQSPLNCSEVNVLR